MLRERYRRSTCHEGTRSIWEVGTCHEGTCHEYFWKGQFGAVPSMRIHVQLHGVLVPQLRFHIHGVHSGEYVCHKGLLCLLAERQAALAVFSSTH